MLIRTRANIGWAWLTKMCVDINNKETSKMKVFLHYGLKPN